MADINFPSEPNIGNTYDYNGIRYTWFEPSPGLGLWKATTPGSVGIATTAEIDTGTDTIKYITPDSLNGAKLRQEGTILAANAAELDVLAGSNASTIDLNKLASIGATQAELDDLDRSANNAFTNFTPTLYGTTTAGSPTYGVRSGKYYRVGNLIFVHVFVSISALGGMSGYMRMSGLPFVSEGSSYIAMMMKNFTSAALINSTYALNVGNSATYADLYHMQSDSSSYGGVHTNSIDANGFGFAGSGIYIAQ